MHLIDIVHEGLEALLVDIFNETGGVSLAGGGHEENWGLRSIKEATPKHHQQPSALESRLEAFRAIFLSICRQTKIALEFLPSSKYGLLVQSTKGQSSTFQLSLFARWQGFGLRLESPAAPQSPSLGPGADRQGLTGVVVCHAQW
ncbi:hypothetical protein PGTUg99_026848 [Puccinia graminis f. sp. tritici]|uniref:Uncharacterized protein n=1 Tax=Puccinia graminis f. sp. tritici TaxID=56615 RepID=A0A5B0RVU3_PUCGR|nr:hypothetical protein PGTUg99_026848 [Puccinia graminis f. sp. tritici]